MPFEKDADGKLQIVFGRGDIEVALGTVPSEGQPKELLLLPGGPHPIGTHNPYGDGRLSTEWAEGIRIRFERPESLVVFIGKAVELLDRMMLGTSHTLPAEQPRSGKDGE